jgi:hypothetical protein
MLWITRLSLSKLGVVCATALIGAGACSGPAPDYQGYNTSLDAIEFGFSDDATPWVFSAAMGDSPLELAQSDDPDLNGVQVLLGSLSGSLLRFPGLAVLSNLSWEASSGELSVALAQQPAKDWGPTVTAALIPRDYLWVRLGACDETTFAWGFLTLDADRFYLREMGPPASLEEMVIGEGTVDADKADEVGDWDLDSEEPGRLSWVHSDWTASAWTVPGQVLLLDHPAGLTVAVANPTSHLSVLKASGVYKYLDIRCDENGDMDQGIGHLQVFDRRAKILRIDASGERTSQEGLLGFYEPVGSGFGVIPEGEANDFEENGKTFFALAGDFGLLFNFGRAQRVGIAVKLGLAGLAE